MDVSNKTKRPHFWRVAQRCCVLAGAIDVGFFFLFHILNSPILAWINVLSVAVYISAYQAYKNRNNRLGSQLVWAEVIIHSALGTMLIGWESGFHYFLLVFIPVLPVSAKYQRAIITLIALWLYYVSLHTVSQFVPPLQPINDTALYFVNLFNLTVVFAMFSYLAFFYLRLIGQAHQKLKIAADTDGLTELFNRRYMTNRLLAAKAESAVATSSIILFDLDRFKLINDTLGHDAGDRVLAATAGIVEQALRPGDEVARWGGEEFLVLLPETSVREASQIAERIRRHLADYNWQQLLNSPIIVTASFGIAELSAEVSVAQALKNADVALYKSKAAGRNQVQK